MVETDQHTTKKIFSKRNKNISIWKRQFSIVEY